MKRITLLLVIFLASFSFSQADFRVGNIFIEQHDVFEKTDSDWFFASVLFNALHTNTHEYIILDELSFQEDDLISDSFLSESERYLRNRGLFTKVDIEIDSVSDDTYDIYVHTKDRWSTYPSILFGSGGGENNYGAKLEEFNLLGTGTYMVLEGLNRSENNIGWQGFTQIKQARLFRTELSFNASLRANKRRTDQSFALFKPYRTDETSTAFGVDASNSFGSDYDYKNHVDTVALWNFNERRARGWFSKGWWNKDKVFMTALVEYHNVDRGSEVVRQAFDNSGKILIAFSSVSREFFETSKLNSYFQEDLQAGGYGQVVLGKIFPIESKGESFYYLGLTGEQSIYTEDIYLYGRITVSSALTSEKFSHTYMGSYGLGMYRFSDKLHLSSRFSQVSVWNWYANRQLILDNDSGLRGYSANKLSGDNRIISNTELRFFPDFRVWVFNMSAAAFYDIGATWNQTRQLNETKFYSSAGLGLRFHFNKSSSADHIFRIDFAFNFEESNFGGIVFTTKQAFSIFEPHEYKLPKIYGTQYDYE